jgi:hypothetical protein
MTRYGLPTLYLLVVFVGGLGTGVFGDRVYQKRVVDTPAVRLPPEQWKKRHMKDLQERLNLTADQSARISTVLDETHAEMIGLMAKSQPEMERIQKEQYDKVNAILSPAQSAEYAKFHAEREKRRMQNRPPQ